MVITDSLAEHRRECFANSTLVKLDENTYKLTPPKRFHWAYVIFTRAGVVVWGDQRFGGTPFGQAVSVPGVERSAFMAPSTADHDEYLGSKFFGRKPTSKMQLERWYNDVRWLSALRAEFTRLYEAAEKAGVQAEA